MEKESIFQCMNYLNAYREENKHFGILELLGFIILLGLETLTYLVLASALIFIIGSIGVFIYQLF